MPYKSLYFKSITLLKKLFRSKPLSSHAIILANLLRTCDVFVCLLRRHLFSFKSLTKCSCTEKHQILYNFKCLRRFHFVSMKSRSILDCYEDLRHYWVSCWNIRFTDVNYNMWLKFVYLVNKPVRTTSWFHFHLVCKCLDFWVRCFVYIYFRIVWFNNTTASSHHIFSLGSYTLRHRRILNIRWIN